MECFIVEKEDVDIDRGELILTGDEAHHALRSLRIQIGEQLLATDLFGISYSCKLKSHSSGAKGSELKAICSIEEILPEFGEPKRNVLLIQGLISQPSRWEFLLEKATELGANIIQPVTTERTERESFNRERSDRILRAAVKQTKRSRIPELREISSLETALTDSIKEGRMVVMLHESVVRGLPSLHTKLIAGTALLQKEFDGGEPIAIAVGPEGGFSEDEVKAVSSSGAKIVSLGPRRLRAETAAIAVLALLI